MEFSLDEPFQELDFLKLFLTDDLIHYHSHGNEQVYRTIHGQTCIEDKIEGTWMENNWQQWNAHFPWSSVFTRNYSQTWTGEYFSHQPLLDTPLFYQTMTELRFSLLQKYLHFASWRRRENKETTQTETHYGQIPWKIQGTIHSRKTC